MVHSLANIVKAGADLVYSLHTQADSDDEGEEDESDEPRATDELEHFQVRCGTRFYAAFLPGLKPLLD